MKNTNLPMTSFLTRNFLVFFVFAYSLFINISFSAAQDSQRLRPNVEILVASWCVHCKDLEKFLRSQNIGYTKLDIEKDSTGARLYQRLGGGGVPMIIIGNSVLKGFDKNALVELFDRETGLIKSVSANQNNLRVDAKIRS